MPRLLCASGGSRRGEELGEVVAETCCHGIDRASTVIGPHSTGDGAPSSTIEPDFSVDGDVASIAGTRRREPLAPIDHVDVLASITVAIGDWCYASRSDDRATNSTLANVSRIHAHTR